MYILGINVSKNATASLLKDGQIIVCIQEERLTRVKNQSGFPFKSVEFCLNYAQISLDQVDLMAFGAKNPFAAIWFRTSKQKTAENLRGTDNSFSSFLAEVSKFAPFALIIYQSLYRFVYLFFKLAKPIIKYLYIQRLSTKLNFPKSKMIFFDHHLSHGFAANYIFGKSEEKRLVITNDGAGDSTCGKVFIVKKAHWSEIAKTPNKYSLAYVYYYVTKLLGFIPDEEEYKVMGLAPYASKEKGESVLKTFKQLIWVEGLSFKSKTERVSFRSFLQANLGCVRFDLIASAVQRLVEDLLVTQVRNAILKTGIKEVVLGGGLAMNIKANMEVLKLPDVSKLLVCPSSSDESVAIGACFLGYKSLCDKLGENFNCLKLDDLYLGPEYKEKDIEIAVRKMQTTVKVRVRKLKKEASSFVVAGLLAKGKVVARFCGRGEFGARALGNRSILANPTKVEIINILNSQIKNRDFWMPFAPTIIEERVSKYLVNPKNIDSPFMMIGFKITKQAREQIPAAIHPYDQTCRPQILKREQNSDYYDIIRQFEKLTGVGALLNTSFNLHGEPIVCTPEDAINTFTNSGLEYLLLENYLIKKLKPDE